MAQREGLEVERCSDRTAPRSIARTDIRTDLIANRAYRSIPTSAIVSTRTTFSVCTGSENQPATDWQTVTA